MKHYIIYFIALFCCLFNQAQSETIYIYRPLLNGHDLQHWAREQGITLIAEEDMHVTLAYSREGIENLPEVIETEPTDYVNSDLDYQRQLDYFGQEKSVLVLKLNAPELIERWQAFMGAGATWDWPIFEPHITLTYEAHGVDLEQITPFYGDLIFGPEVYIEY